jgi:hypothetical protein
MRISKFWGISSVFCRGTLVVKQNSRPLKLKSSCSLETSATNYSVMRRRIDRRCRLVPHHPRNDKTDIVASSVISAIIYIVSSNRSVILVFIL